MWPGVGMHVAPRRWVRQFPRPGRVMQRIGTVLPAVSGEIQARPARAAGDRGHGVMRLGLWTVTVDLDAAPDGHHSANA